MSRSGYTDECDDMWTHIRWRGAVKSAIKGERGQSMLRELAEALDAMPVKELVANEFQADGQFCTLGVVAAARGIDLERFDPEDCREDIAKSLGIAEALAAEVMYENDEAVTDWKWVDVVVCGPMRRWERHERSLSVPDPSAPARRWAYMRQWVAAAIRVRERGKADE